MTARSVTPSTIGRRPRWDKALPSSAPNMVGCACTSTKGDVMAEIRKPTATAKRMWALPAAEFAVDNAMMVNGGESKQITIPSPAFLIEHPQGLVLFDTGLSPHAIADPAAYYGPLFSAIQMDFGPEKAIDRG